MPFRGVCPSFAKHPLSANRTRIMFAARIKRTRLRRRNPKIRPANFNLMIGMGVERPKPPCKILGNTKAGELQRRSFLAHTSLTTDNLAAASLLNHILAILAYSCRECPWRSLGKVSIGLWKKCHLVPWKAEPNKGPIPAQPLQTSKGYSRLTFFHVLKASAQPAAAASISSAVQSGVCAISSPVAGLCTSYLVECINAGRQLGPAFV